MSSDGKPVTTLSGGAVVMLSHDEREQHSFDAHSWLEVVGHGWVVQPKHRIFIGPESVIAAADLDSLREAMLEERCCAQLPDSPERVAIAIGQEEDFHPDSTSL